MLLNLTVSSLQNIYRFPHLLPFVLVAFIGSDTMNVFKLELLLFWMYNDLASQLYESCMFSSLGLLILCVYNFFFFFFAPNTGFFKVYWHTKKERQLQKTADCQRHMKMQEAAKFSQSKSQVTY